ncbi:hypothetical protein CPB85DRAFT_1433405 [Mucidula mucida]|nr:hypothetical protein CPB85DRAFT_1433405 [Mucidula mucida]
MSLTSQLNELLNSLHIDIPKGIQSPTDLTPSLLIAILESVLAERLPIPTELRHSRDHDTIMKVFLGVLETDILKSDDFELSKIDPRRLARGEWDEVNHVAEVLCWIGRREGLVHGHSDRGSSPTTTTSTESATTVDGEFEGESPSLLPPRCIHEIPSPFLAISPTILPEEWDEDEPSNSSNNLLLSVDSKVSPPVRYEGIIAPVDEDWEISSFESYYSNISSNTTKRPRKTIYDHRYEDQMHLADAFLRERARCCAQIAQLESGRFGG